ncbi:LysR family transcriptional regulator [Photobacterium aphoticum]|uniref:C4-dicarboxylate ABC transporter substrate-binding protein n=1 Tax=Photobacterium aphoticum TaxID=754436 RepID=A0A0J1GJC8_9GAMM|nr:LysR family transcriptional regulator [Photobacterium aphoticum]KLU99832.1 C4-dicarboxylate ABC transporter substrate-binding protein [Photobacterium aphoticum]PSU59481.1 LysR family transcriptional regulator [Photobacterium aphoticum]GHA40344.1 LysR family transcriptional regulator [Photobacterium aphoticum]
MNLDTKWLEDFLMLADLQHFSRAAEARHITQPAFGRHIRALEKAIGQPLIDRSTTPISLTPAGRQFRTVARNMIAQMEDGLKLLNGIEQPLQNPIRIASPHSLSSPTLLDLIDHVNQQQDMPFSVDILRVDCAVDSLIQGQCDFFLGFEIHSLLQPPFSNVCIGQGDFLLVSATNSNGEPLFQPSAEHATPIIRYSADSYSARLIEQHQPGLKPLHTYPVFESSMCQLHKDMALRGKGLAWLPDAQIQHELAAGTLKAIDPTHYRFPYQIRLYRNSAPLRHHAQQLWQQLHSDIQQGWQLSRAWHATHTLVTD